LARPWLGVFWDGEDSGGGEFYLGPERVAQLRSFPLPGSNPQACALGLLSELGLPLSLGYASGDQKETLDENCPRTTSAARLFDGVAGLSGCSRSELEGLATGEGCYPMAFRDGILDWRPTVLAIRQELLIRVPLPMIAYRFHRSLARGIFQVARRCGAKRVLLVGDCFRNRLLTGLTREELGRAGCEVEVPR
jgi:hydrogenase maturation protein HypF